MKSSCSTISLGRYVYILCVRLSADNNHPDGLFHAGECLLSGSGVRQDVKAAFQHIKKSAEMGCNKAQNRMALLLEDGIGTVQDLNHAFYWFQKASADGHPDATYNLSRFYENGSGIEPDLKMAHELLTQVFGFIVFQFYLLPFNLQ